VIWPLPSSFFPIDRRLRLIAVISAIRKLLPFGLTISCHKEPPLKPAVVVRPLIKAHYRALLRTNNRKLPSLYSLASFPARCDPLKTLTLENPCSGVDRQSALPQSREDPETVFYGFRCFNHPVLPLRHVVKRLSCVQRGKHIRRWNYSPRSGPFSAYPSDKTNNQKNHSIE